MWKQSPDNEFITDKTPANYLALGLIPLILPSAKIIHVKRNPMNTCVSCFKHLFNERQDATYDWLELGRHYAAYARQSITDVSRSSGVFLKSRMRTLHPTWKGKPVA